MCTLLRVFDLFSLMIEVLSFEVLSFVVRTLIDIALICSSEQSLLSPSPVSPSRPCALRLAKWRSLEKQRTLELVVRVGAVRREPRST